MNIKLKRFWFEFEFENKSVYHMPPGIGIGCGVTAFDSEDAITLMDEKVFITMKRPPLKKVIEDVDIRELDQHHVIPNMGTPVDRGIWFPLGYE